MLSPDAATQVMAPADTAATYAWAPTEPAKKKRRLGLWIGIPAAAAIVALVAASLVLIAPGASVAGVGVGGMTQGAAAEAISNRLAQTTIEFTGTAGNASVSGAQLGASVDATRLAEAVFADHPMWKVTDWFAPSTDAAIALDPAKAEAALRAALPSLYTTPTNAVVAFDAATANYTVTPAVAGTGVDLTAVQSALQTAFNAGQTSVKVSPAQAAVQATTTTDAATATATSLNTMLDTVGFYVGDERTVPVDRAVAASWLTVAPNAAGKITITANEAEIQKVVDALPAAVDRAPVNATTITDTDGKVLSAQTAGVTGRTIGATAGIAAAFAAQIAGGNAAYALPVTETPFATTTLARSIEVNLSQQKAYLYENGVVVQSYLISSGLPGHDTNTGHFKIYAKLKSQNMGNPDLTKAPNYYTKNVPNVSYFNGDEALHGAYWHHNFGNRMSHGCVNMPLDAAAYVYSWAPIGTPVWVHN